MTSPATGLLARKRTERHAEHVMGTVVSFEIRPGDINDDAVAAALAEACRELHATDHTFSLWKTDSALSRIHRGELEFWDAPPEVAEVFARCVRARNMSHGWFDPWQLGSGFDPTGLVKGWTAMRALKVLRDAGIEAAMVNAGGDIAMFGETADGPWCIGVRDPADHNRALFAVSGCAAIATSGTYERGAHIFDPFAREHRTAALSATVTGPDLDLADALATAVVCAGMDALEMLSDATGYEACLVLDDGTLRATRDFPFA